MKKSILLLLAILLVSSLWAQILIPETYERSRYSNMNDILDLSYRIKRNVFIPAASIDTSGNIDASDTINYYIRKEFNTSLLISKEYNRMVKLILPKGTIRISRPIQLMSNIRLFGASANETKLLCDVGEGKHCITISPVNEGKPIKSINTGKLLSEGSLNIQFDSSPFKRHKLYLGGLQQTNDAKLVTSIWARGSVEELFSFGISNNSWDDDSTPNQYYLQHFGVHNFLPELFSQQREFYPTFNNSIQDTSIVVNYYNQIYNAGVHCLSINRLDTTNSQTSNILFQNAVYCHVRGVKSEGCNFGHITLNRSAGCIIKRNHIFKGNGYGGGGKAYGIVLQQSSTHNTVTDNTLHQLRHSILLQSGANKNAIIANYSYDPFWEQVGLPSDAAGDLVLHGNYPFGNIFEFNVAQQIVIDDSHGKNGPKNIFHRNLLQGYGIFMSAANGSDSQVFTGNEITNTGFIKGLYTLQDNGHFQYGNRVKGSISPSNTGGSLQNSVCYYNRYRHEDDPIRTGFSWSPITFINMDSIPFGEPFNQTGGIPAWKNPQAFPSCIEASDGYGTSIRLAKTKRNGFIYPNPSYGWIKSKEKGTLTLYDLQGRIVLEQDIMASTQIKVQLKGLFIAHLMTKEGSFTQKLSLNN